MIFLLANWRAVLTAALIILPCAYAAVMKVRFENTRAEYATYRAQVAAVAAEAEIRNAQTAVEHEKNAREAIDDLQTRNDAISARYERLRQSTAVRGGSVSAAPGAAPAPSPDAAGQPDAVARCVADAQAVLKLGDMELAKFKELWELGEKNAK